MDSTTVETERFYRDIFETITDGVPIIDLETGVVLIANSSACGLHGYSPEEFIGLSLSVFIHPNSQRVFGNYLRAYRPGLAFDIRVLHVRRGLVTSQ